MLQFKNEATAQSYEALTSQDHTVTKAGVYSGKLSSIPPAMAEAMVKQGSNLLKSLETAGENGGSNEAPYTLTQNPEIQTSNPEGAAQQGDTEDTPEMYSIQ